MRKRTDAEGVPSRAGHIVLRPQSVRRANSQHPPCERLMPRASCQMFLLVLIPRQSAFPHFPANRLSPASLTLNAPSLPC